MSPRILVMHLVAIGPNDIARDSECYPRAIIRIETQVGKLALGRFVVELA